MIRGFRHLAALALVLCGLVNVGRFAQDALTYPPRETDDRIIWERRLTGIRNELIRVQYTSGDIGYVPAGVLEGKRRTEREDVDWVQVRYAMIPLNVLQDSLDAPYVIAESSHDVDGFETIYSGRNGLLLLRKK
jgi:hypothetical protein